MAPAIMAQIPIYIRNTFEPEHPGTRIFISPNKDKQLRERSVCGFTTVDGIALLNIEGTGMIGVPGIAHRLFGALKTANISVMYIAQASSEYSICFATREINADCAKDAISEAFFYELKQGLISDIRIIRNCAIIAAVGEQMSNTPGVSGIFFSALGDASINILSISQGCDEKNISAVVYASDATKALKAVHSAFLLSSLDLSIGIVGTGRVGSAVILTLLEQIELLNHQFGLNIKIRGIANSNSMILGEDLTENLKTLLDDFFPPPSASLSSKKCASDNGHLMNTDKFGNKNESNNNFKRTRSSLSLTDVGKFLMSSSPSVQSRNQEPSNLTKFLEHLRSGATPHAIIVDCTPSSEVAALHPEWLKGSVHIVTANKRGMIILMY